MGGGGGGGGGFFGRRADPSKLAQEVRQEQRKAEDQQFDAGVSGILNTLLAGFNDRDVEGINTRLQSIKEALSSEIQGTVDLIFGGSVAKHTYVDGLSDVDSLVLIEASSLSGKSPEEVKAYFADRLTRRFPNTAISQGKLAVTVRYADIEIQLLPAVRDGARFRIPDPSGSGWSHINARAFAEALTHVNRENAAKVVPTIKLAKSIMSGFPDTRRLSGYHTEALAVEVFRQYDGPRTTKSMIKHFFAAASSRVLSPIADRTGQSIHVDDYLGSANSLERRVVADALQRVARRMQNADGARLTAQWCEILGVPHSTDDT